MYNFDDLLEQVKEVIDYSQNYESSIVEIDTMLREWQRNKQPLIDDFFNGDLIAEFPEKLHFRLGDTARKHLYSNFLDYTCLRLNNYQLCRFLEDQGENAFFENVVEHDYNYGEISIPKGSKIVRSFKFFIDDKELLTKAQNEASRVIQNDGIEGILGVSVHPLDFLSLSENTYNWRSCHALDGEYRAGNLSYMMDGITFVCYLRGDDSEKLPHFPESVPWHSKKWRCLGFLSDDLKSGIMMGRPYPYPAADILETIRERIFNNEWGLDFGSWHDDAIDRITNRFNGYDEELLHPYVPVHGELVDLSEVIHDNEDATHYNDLLNSSVYTPIYARKRRWTSVSDFKKVQYHIGHRVDCLICGGMPVESGNNTMLCRYCELKYGESDSDDIVYCAHCGTRMFYEESIVVNDNDYICQTCFDQIGSYCDKCGQAYYINDMHEVKDAKGNIELLCEWCERDLKDSIEETQGAQELNLKQVADRWFASHSARDTAMYFIRDDDNRWVPLGAPVDIDEFIDE